MDITTDAASVNHNFAGAALLLAAATAGGLTAPYSISISEYRIEIHLWTYDGFVEWAQWIEEPIEVLGNGTTSRAQGDVFGFQVDVLGPIESAVA